MIIIERYMWSPSKGVTDATDEGISAGVPAKGRCLARRPWLIRVFMLLFPRARGLLSRRRLALARGTQLGWNALVIVAGVVVQAHPVGVRPALADAPG